MTVRGCYSASLERYGRHVRLDPLANPSRHDLERFMAAPDIAYSLGRLASCLHHQANGQPGLLGKPAEPFEIDVDELLRITQ
jgi:hypothetical protein